MSAVQGSTRQPTKIFGLQLGIDPKFLVGGLIVLAVLLFWLNSRGEGSSSTPVTGSRPEAVAPLVTPANNRGRNTRRNRSNNVDRGALRIRPVDPTHGDIDPTLRLELLARLQSVTPPKPGRSLFEIGPDSATETAKAQSAPFPQGPRIPVKCSSLTQFAAPVSHVPFVNFRL